MTTYNASTVSDTAIASGKPITLQQGRALRDNPLAQGEGTTDAPYVQAAWHPYDGITIGDGNDGLIYDFAVAGAVGSLETPAWADGYEYRLMYERITHNSGSNQALQLELYKSSDAAYTSAIAIDPTSAGLGSTISGFTEIYRPRILLASVNIWTAITVAFTGYTTLNVSSLTGANKYSKGRLSFTGGSIGGGKIYMQKRLCYA